MRDPYTVLGVTRAASQDDIKQAYRKLAKQFHPDRNPDDEQITERFKEVSAAYRILSDEKLRGRYDRGEIDASGAERAFARGFNRSYAHAGQDGRFEGFAAGNSESAEDIFSELFGSFRRNNGRRTFRSRGQDQKYSLKVGFLEAAKGVTKRLTLPKGRTLDVKIPAGVTDGQQIRLKEQGEAGQGGAAPGDVLIEVQIEPHPFFTRQGQDIHLELPVTLQEAVLGARINAPTIHGMVALTVPKGSNTGTTLRLKGKGLAEAGSRAAGDQYVKLKVVLPERRDPELEKLVQTWASGHDYAVRDRFRAE